MYKIQLKLTSFSHNNLTNFLDKLKLKDITNISLKKKSNVLTLLKSPHVHKKSRIQYKFIYYKQVVFIKSNSFLNLLFLIKQIHKFKNNSIQIKILITKNLTEI